MAARIFWELFSRSPTVTFICASATRSGRIFMRGVLSQRLSRALMDILIYAIHVVPFVIIVYFAFDLFLHPPKAVILASLAGGLVMAVINALADLLAYYASWWHYTASGLILQLPLPFYLTPMLIYGGVAYMLVWRFGGAGQAQGPRLSTQPPLVPTQEARFGGVGQAQGPTLSSKL